MWNVFGDVNVLWRRDSFLKLGGFGTPAKGTGCEDYEIGVRAAVAGMNCITIPAVLYDYRFSEHNMARTMSNVSLYYSHDRINRQYERLVGESDPSGPSVLEP